MALQSSGQISLSDIATEFGGSEPHELSEYYGSDTVPESGEITLSDFYGTSNAVFMAATGGTTTTSGDYKIHTFTSSGTFNITQVGNAAGSNSIEYLVVGGGGNAGTRTQNHDYNGTGGSGGGGGGGSVLTGTKTSLSTGNQSITVGGGTGTSSALGISAGSGGNGGSAGSEGVNGSSGSGGGGGAGVRGGTFGSGGAGSNGGNGGSTSGSGYMAGGGGGGSTGANGSSNIYFSTSRAQGTYSSISGSSVHYARGGARSPSGFMSNFGRSASGAANSGEGGQGTAHYNSGEIVRYGGYGGSGIVILKYKFQ